MDNKQLDNIIASPLMLLDVYFRTFRAMIFHPEKTLFRLQSTENHPYAIPGFFLISNIALSYLIGRLLGDKIPEFSMDIPFLPNLYSGHYSILIRFILGIFVLLYILRCFMKPHDSRAFILRIFPILCYSSIVYIPFVILRHYTVSRLGKDIFRLLYGIQSGIGPPEFPLWDVLLLSMLLALYLWWFWLMYAGLSHPRKNPWTSPPKIQYFKIFFSTCLIYELTKIILGIVLTCIVSWPFLWGIKIISCREIQSSLSKQPPDYVMAAILASQISSNKSMSPSLRYRYSLEEVSYWLASPLGDGKTVFANEIIKKVKNKEYGTVHTLLKDHISRVASDRTNPNRKIYNQMVGLLADADNFYNYPSFIDPTVINRFQVFVSTMFNMRPDTVYFYKRDQDGIAIQVVFVLDLDWVTIFPAFS